MSSAYNGRIDAARKKAKPEDRLERLGLGYRLWVIPRFAEQRPALKFVQFASKPENQKTYSHKIAYGPTNKSAVGMIDPKVLPSLPTAPANLNGALGINVQFWVDHGEELEERFNAWAAK